MSGAARGRKSKVNPFDKYLTKEDLIHIAIIKYVVHAYPGICIMHAPLEGKRSDFERYKANKLGLNESAGFPDFLFIYKCQELFLEIKTVDGVLSGPQTEWIKNLIKNGKDACVGYGIDECLKMIDERFGPLKKAKTVQIAGI